MSPMYPLLAKNAPSLILLCPATGERLPHHHHHHPPLSSPLPLMGNLELRIDIVNRMKEIIRYKYVNVKGKISERIEIKFL